jgi:predicted nucleic acid-binding protein
MKVLLDTNVILDAMLQRTPWHVQADAILREGSKGHVTCATTSLSLATIFYVGRKVVGTAAARSVVRQYLSAFVILPVDKQALLDADAFAGVDFEDNILIAAAVTASLDAIITRDATDFAHSPIPAWDPTELLGRLQGGGSSNDSGGDPP